MWAGGRKNAMILKETRSSEERCGGVGRYGYGSLLTNHSIRHCKFIICQSGGYVTGSGHGISFLTD